MGTPDAFKWIAVISFDLDHEAGLCKSYLESHGLKVRLNNDFITRAYPAMAAATGGIQVLVADRDVIRASTLLQQAGYLDHSISPGSNFLERRFYLIAALLIALVILVALYFAFFQ